jgi:hypothetical protein
LKDMTREEKEREREKRDREMQEERREAARIRNERFAQVCLVYRRFATLLNDRWTKVQG